MTRNSRKIVNFYEFLLISGQALCTWPKAVYVDPSPIPTVATHYTHGETRLFALVSPLNDQDFLKNCQFL